MIVRTYVSFNTDIPDDRIETEDGMDFIQWPGRNVAEAMADLLKRSGWTPEDVIDLEERGWELDATCGGRSVTLRIQLIEEVLVIFIDRSPDRTWYFRRKPPGLAFTGLLTEFDKALKADSRFSDVLWFTPDGYQKDEPGAPAPIET